MRDYRVSFSCYSHFQEQKLRMKMKGMNHCSKMGLIGGLVCVSLFGIMLFYWSCEMNYLSCPHTGYIFASPKVEVDGFLIEDAKKQKRGLNNNTNNDANSKILLTNNRKKHGDLPQRNNHLKLGHTTFIKKIFPYQQLNGTRNFYANECENDNIQHCLDISDQTSNIQRHSYSKEHTLRSNDITTAETVTEGIYVFHNISCNALYPDALLYNRIFKTGSSSVGEYMNAISSPLNYIVDLATTEDWYKTGNSYPYPDIIQRHVNQSASRIAFVAHFFFRRYLNITKPYTYINIVREPVQRIISHYKYMRTDMRPSYRIMEMKRDGLWNESLIHCINNEHRGCESNVMTRFLCGTKTICKTGSKKALKLAKRNVKRYYAAIGLQEHLSLFLDILKLILPDYFNYGNNKLSRVKQNNERNNHDNIPVKVMDIIRKKNSADINLYNVLKNRFWTQLKRCRM